VKTDVELAMDIRGQTRGDAADAETELYLRFAPRVRLYGLRHLPSRDEADDLVQHVLALTIERLRGGAVRDVGRIDSFIFGVARMVARDFRKGEGRRRRLSTELSHSLPTAVEERTPLDTKRLAECMQGLAERSRTVVALSFFADRSAALIASELAISEGNVRVIRHRAVASLQRCMQEEPG